MHCELHSVRKTASGVRQPNMRFFSTIASLLLLTALIAPLAAQTQTGPIVKDIVVEYVGPPAIAEGRVLDNMATKVGEPYSERAAEADIRALYATGGVANVRICAEPMGDGVKVTVLLQGRPVVEEILIEGADQIPMNRVRREIGSKVGEVLSEQKLEDDRQKILKIYEDRNYSDVEVQYSIQEISATNRVRVIFQINEGPRLVVRKIED